MKKNIIIMALLSFFSCEKKYYLDSEDFIKIEKTAEVSSNRAYEIYKENFEREFKVNANILVNNTFLRDNKKIIYLLNNEYYIGYRSLLDKRADEHVPLKFLAKVNSNTGKMTAVK